MTLKIAQEHPGKYPRVGWLAYYRCIRIVKTKFVRSPNPNLRIRIEGSARLATQLSEKQAMHVGRDEIVRVGPARLSVDGSANILVTTLGGQFAREIVFNLNRRLSMCCTHDSI